MMFLFLVMCRDVVLLSLRLGKRGKRRNSEPEPDPNPSVTSKIPWQFCCRSSQKTPSQHKWQDGYVLCSFKLTNMPEQDDGLSAFLPKSMGKKPEKGSKAMPQVEIEEDDFEVEEPVADAALMAMMPMSFGKQDKKRDLSASFAKTKRVQIPPREVANEQQESTSSKPEPAKIVAPQPVNDEEDDESSDDMIGPMPAAEDSEDEEEEDDEDEFPISHEVVLKDHHKVPFRLADFTNDRLSRH